MNNMGAASREQIEQFASFVLADEFPGHVMKWTTAGSILIGTTVYIDEQHIGKYPWQAKEIVLHEIAHINTWPEDMRHGEIFYAEYIRLLTKYMLRDIP